MCGRFALRTSVPELARLLGVEPPLPDLAPRYNIAPTQTSVVCVARGEGGGRALVAMRWGLVPHWAKDLSFGARAINARAETAAEKPAFRDAYRRRRCLVPVDGYYEWRAAKPVKQPFFIHAEDGAPLMLAGLWSRWHPPQGPAVETFTILTTEANAALARVHHRMPVALDAGAREAWLDPALEDPGVLGDLVAGSAAPALALHPVSTFVNKAANDDARCVEPLVDPPLLAP